MLIVEGPDGSGKSTLVRRLSSDLKLPVANKVVGSDTEPLTDLVKWTERNVQAGFQPMIFDRHRLISEPIYGPIMRDRQDRNFLDLGWLSEQMWLFYNCKPLIIYCLPDPRTVWTNVTNAETNNGSVRGYIGKIYASYVARASMDMTRGQALVKLFNYRTTRYDELLQWINFKLEEKDIKGDSVPRIPQQSDASAAAAHFPRIGTYRSA